MAPLPSATLLVVGDVHRYWRAEDADFLERERPDLALFVGDLGDEDVQMVRKIAALRVPKAVILGNHDAWQSFSRKEATGRLIESVKALGDDHLAYRVREVPCGGFSLVGARPFSWGGPNLRSPEVYEEMCGVRTMKESAARIMAAARDAQHRDIVVLAHNGPIGLSGSTVDIYGKDFGKPGGDWGDRDLALAIERMAKRDLRVRCVIAGHMHHQVLHPRGAERTRFVRRGETLYINPAVVPRLVQDADGTTLSYFLRMRMRAGECVELVELWVDPQGQIRRLEEPVIKELPDEGFQRLAGA